MESPDCIDVPKTARLLAERLASLPELPMRRAVLAGWLGEVPPEDAVEVLACVLRESHAGPPMYQIALAALVSLRGDDSQLPYPLERALYLEARSRTTELAHLFLSLTVQPGDGSQRRPIQKPDGRPLTLGERKQLARAGRRDLVLKLLQDPSCEVVSRALTNPSLTEADVVRLTARRPTEPEIQQAIFASARWSSRRAVRRALVLNPYTPKELAVRVVTLLSSGDLAAVAGDLALDPVVRDTALHLKNATGPLRRGDAS